MAESIYDAAGGADGMLRLAHAWHVRVLADPVVSHAFSHGFREDHTERLAAYLGEALGGPADYTASMGEESEVVRLHSGNGTHEEMDRLALDAWDAALADCGLAADPQPSGDAPRLLRGRHSPDGGAPRRGRDGARRSRPATVDVGERGDGPARPPQVMRAFASSRWSSSWAASSTFLCRHSAAR